MAHINLNIADGFVTKDVLGKNVNAMVKVGLYQVICEEGLFKNGKHYTKGEKIELVEKAATNFLNNNEIVKSES